MSRPKVYETPDELSSMEITAQTLFDIKSLLIEAIKIKPASDVQEKLLIMVNKQLDALNAIMLKGQKGRTWRHTPVYDNNGKIQSILSQPEER